MLSLEYRPRTFAEMAGQDIVKKSLLHISKDPTNAPKTILLCGAFGTGKTTAARIFARALNCQHKLPNGDACVDKDTQFFNGYKWKYIKDYVPGDKVLQYNEDGTTTLVEPLRYIKEPCDHFYRIYGKNFDIVATEDHDIVYLNRSGKLTKMKYIDFLDNHRSIDNIRAKFISSFKYSGAGIHLSNDAIRLQVAVIADGNYIPQLKKPNYCRIVIKKQRKKERLRMLLNNLGITWKELSDGEYSTFKFDAPLHTKVFDHFWYSCNNEQLQVIADELLYWDGCKSQSQFSTSDFQTKEFVQFMYAALGRRCHVTRYLASQSGGQLTKDNYTLTISDKGYVDTTGNSEYKFPIEYYESKDGYKYCFTVPSHMWVSRRKDKIVVTGNCGECEFCKSDIQDSMFYSEYDSAIVGNVKDIRELRNTFYFGYTKGYKVIVLDEVHLISKQAQGALLKVIEEPEPNVFYILCTTDPDKLLNTITSRSYALQYETVPPSDMIPFLEKVLTSKGITIDDTVKENLNLIAKRSNGHMRNAMMLLDSMLLLKEDFRDTVIDSTPTFIKFLTLSLSYKETAIQLIQKDLNGATDDASKQASISKVNTLYNQKVLSVIDELNKFNLNQLYQDYQNLVRRIAINIYGMAEDADLINIVSKFKNSSELIEVLNDDLILSGFKSSVTFNTSMVILYNKLKTLKG